MSDFPLHNTADSSSAAPLPVGLTSRKLVLHLARQVHAARARAGLTQRELADNAELSRGTVHLIEAGLCDARLSTVARLAEALHMDPKQLLSPLAGDSV